jgi:hypothetical protein
MTPNYTTPLARWARFFEIIIPAYMFGKSWGLADEKTADLFRAEFPPFLIDGAEYLKGLVPAGNEVLGRFYATYAGALLGLLIVLILAVVMHYVLRDRKFIDSLRFTSVTLLPLALLNGTLSHVMKTLLENVDAASATGDVLKKTAVDGSMNYFYFNFAFYMIALWMFAQRTGVKRARRWGVLGVGVLFIALYIACGLLIMPGEWAELQPKLLESLSH